MRRLSPRAQWTLQLVLAVILISVLGGFYARMQRYDSRDYAQKLAIVHQLQQLDTQWELDVIKSNSGISANYDPLVDPLVLITQLQQRLRTAASQDRRAARSPFIRANEALGSAIREKTRLIEMFKSHNAVLQNSLTFLPSAADDAQIEGQLSEPAGVKFAAHSGRINDVLLSTLIYSQAPSLELQTGVERMSAQLSPPRREMVLNERLELFRAHVGVVLREKPLVRDLLRRISDVPTTSRIEEYDRLLADEERQADRGGQQSRQFLLFFVATLIALLFFSAVRLLRGHAMVNRMNRQLSQANSELESRVDERTIELLVTNAELRERETRLSSQSHQLAIARDVAEAANDAKSAFLATMSHELRTPLNAIIGFTELMQTALFGPLGHPKYVEYVGDVNKSGSHLLALINDILDLSRLDAGKADLFDEEFSLSHLISEVCRSLEPLARHSRLKIITDVPANLPEIRADERRIRQIMLNLVSNAIKFTPSDGAITIKAWDMGADLAIQIRDTGIGMSSAELPTALERFGQVDARLARQFGGTGLGLPLAKQLIEIHDGTFEIQSELGVGTIVTIILPSDRILRPSSLGNEEIVRTAA
jgi:signal transduction histidine kinase